MTIVKKNLFLGVLLTTLSFLGITVINVIVKLINNRISPAQIMLVQNIICMLVFLFVSLIKARSFSFLKSSHLFLHFIRGFTGVVTYLLIYFSLGYMSVANVTLLFNTIPFFIPFLLYLCFKEPIDHRLWIGIIIGFLGIIFILNPHADIFHWGAFFPLFAGVTGAALFVALGRLHHYHEPTLRILFYAFFFGSLLCIPLVAFQWKNPSFQDWTFLISSAILLVLAQAAVTIGFRYASPSVLAPLCYTAVVFALIFDWLIWKHVPTLHSWIGMLFVIVGGIVTLIIESSNKDKGFV